MSDPKPMDPDRLTIARVRGDRMRAGRNYDPLMAELLADRDHWEGEAVRLSPKAAALTLTHAQLLVMAGLELGASLAECGAVIRGRLDALKTLSGLRDDMEAQRDEARVEAKRYRARCPVTAEDVEAAGVTRGKAQAFYDHLGDGVIVEWDAIGQRATLANYVNASAAYLGRPAFDILDEMAAQEAP